MQSSRKTGGPKTEASKLGVKNLCEKMNMRSPTDLSFSIAVNDYLTIVHIRLSLDFQDVFINFIFYKLLTVQYLIIAYVKRYLWEQI